MDDAVERMPAASGSWLAAGAVCGGVSVTVFTVLHHLLISPIWWMFPVMLVAGAICGVCIAWSYTQLVPEGSRGSWALYVTMHTVMFGLLALCSQLLYEPVITMAEMLESTGGNPLPISETLPLMTVFTVVWSGVSSTVCRAGARGFLATLATTSVLMLLLGINVSTIGLVDIPGDAWSIVAEFFGYIIALGAVYGAGMAYAMPVRSRGSLVGRGAEVVEHLGGEGP